MLAKLQKLGKSLMLPVATLPAAGILQGLGLIDYQKDIPLGAFGAFLNQYVTPFMTSGALAILDNLPIIFAIGVAIGFAGDAVAALSALIGYLVLTRVLEKVPLQIPFIADDVKLNMGVLGGILVGVWSAYLFNKYHKIKLPDWLGFFAGKRFVPIITAASVLVLAALVGMIWYPIQLGIAAFGNWIVGLGGIGAFLFGTANRLLIPTGLHHVLNTIAWFQIGDFTNAAGQVVQGDLTRFMHGDKSAGMFMSGFFPIMMFAVPAIALAFVHTAKPSKRKLVGSLVISSAVASFLTGITEPLEFAFMFLAPVLYVVHALLAGLSGLIMYLLDVHLGFAFSAGMIDYLLYLKLSTNAWLLFPVGLAFGVVYYLLFRFLIVKLNLKTPGREDDDDLDLSSEDAGTDGQSPSGAVSKESKAAKVLQNIGGADNITSIDACITRLRLVVKDEKAVKDSELKKLGASGVMRLGQGAVQIVFGPQAESIKDDIKDIMKK
ncbi:PTS transporter subunit EIIC [Paenibacillus glucanolyticus]|uniref:PTS transporter subunit EIIC n=1 Tax=Paenibacillus TaxID=44249 RepID=UPI002475F4D7|nr:PTS transporter subunit EIIC [Paenibacillus sp. LBL]MDH6669367.1 PTS system N-acetylglucosamine-specific IIC component [Paenibacillus sp. LBL]